MTLTIDGTCTLLLVYDMPTSIAFYRDLLGFQVWQSAPAGDDCDWCWLKRDNTELMLNTQFERTKRPSAADERRQSMHADTTLYMGCPDVDAAYAYLRERGVTVVPPVLRDYGMRQLHFKDPDGYGLCLQWAAGAPASAAASALYIPGNRSLPGNRSMPDSAIIPVLAYGDAQAAARWLVDCFGFRERLRIGGHRVQLTHGDAAVVAITRGVEQGDGADAAHSIMLRVPDVDAHYAHAVQMNVRTGGAPVTHPYGERQYSAEDIGGHAWTFSQSVADVDPRTWGGELR